MLPLMIEMKGRKVTVAGGGNIALRKLRVFMEHGADVTVVSPQAVAEIRKLAGSREIQWKQKNVEKTDLEGAFIILAATDKPEINEWIKDQAAQHQLVSLVDQGSLSDFHMASFMQRGHLSVSVSTHGASPILGKKICRQFMEQIDESFIEELSLMAQKRKEINRSAVSREEKVMLLKQMAEEV
jgi:precorrin-2 dehydrogenase / sirohydrochlorin ferrochelatase